MVLWTNTESRFSNVNGSHGIAWSTSSLVADRRIKSHIMSLSNWSVHEKEMGRPLYLTASSRKSILARAVKCFWKFRRPRKWIIWTRRICEEDQNMWDWSIKKSRDLVKCFAFHVIMHFRSPQGVFVPIDLLHESIIRLKSGNTMGRIIRETAMHTTTYSSFSSIGLTRETTGCCCKSCWYGRWSRKEKEDDRNLRLYCQWDWVWSKYRYLSSLSSVSMPEIRKTRWGIQGNRRYDRKWWRRIWRNRARGSNGGSDCWTVVFKAGSFLRSTLTAV